MKHLPDFLRTVLGGLLLACLFTGCSTYSSQWHQAAKTTPPAGSIAGAWEGYWLSNSNGHTGKLRCIITPQTGDQYDFHYWATFWKVFSYSYRAQFTVQKTNDLYILHGKKDLGYWAGGAYTHDGQGSATNFVSTYHSKYDAGIFHLQRPAEADCGCGK